MYGGGKCSLISFEMDNDVCEHKDGAKNKRGKKDCSAMDGCSWEDGKGGGTCTLDVPSEDTFWSYLWYIAFKDDLATFRSPSPAPPPSPSSSKRTVQCDICFC
jgi:hypothetical protein